MNSQFVILPPYQQQGHGCKYRLFNHIHSLSIAAKLYSTLFSTVQTRPEVAELTVEDPAEAFEDLRDRNDLRFLVKERIVDDPQFADGIGADTRGPRAKWEDRIRRKYKLAQVCDFTSSIDDADP